MKVSVIIPIYNTAQYLEKCISSILKQTYTDFELIAINDGSSDGSEDIIKKFIAVESRIVYRDFNNAGVGASRNRGLDVATGEYVIFIDSDDWVDPDFIKDFVVNIISQNNRLVVQDLKEVDKQMVARNVQGYNNQLLKIPQDLELFIGNFRFTQGYPWNKFYKLSIIKDNNIRFVEGPVMNEDELFYMDYIKQVDEIYFVAKDNYNYLQRNNSMTSKLFTFPETLKYLQGLLSFLNYLTSVKKDSPEIKSYTEKRINHIFDYALRAGIYGHNYPWKTRLSFLLQLYGGVTPFIDVLKPKTQLQKMDLVLFKNKQFLILDLLITIKTRLN
ncbi:glycosyltransferase family 2 protein [Chryseobacterium sp. NEB161]|nr:glycosyltransferase family 2 protein [Chryseobacterium sp. NEB161]